MHTLLDLRGPIPSFIHISDGKMGDVRVLDIVPPEPGAFFVTRGRSNFVWRRLYSAEIDRSAGLVCDHTIVLEGAVSRKRYSERFRRIKFDDPETNKAFVFLTNNFILPASTIWPSTK